MITFGQDLYGLAERDLNSILLDVYNPGKVDTPFGIGNALLTVVYPLPVDRNLYLASCSGFWNGGAVASRIQEVNLQYTPPSGFSGAVRIFTHRNVAGLSHDGPAAGQTYSVTHFPGILLPRGGALELRVVRAIDTTTAGSSEFSLYGWTVPPGNLARGS